MAVALFVIFWIVVALALVFIGLRGGPRGAREALQSQTRGGRRTTAVLVTVVVVIFGLGLPAVILAGNGNATGRMYKSVKLTREDVTGQKVFGRLCSSCHTLNAARAQGTVGPNLDELKPPKSLILNALAVGRQRGNGTMPAGLVTGPDAEYVAGFVSKVAGR